MDIEESRLGGLFVLRPAGRLDNLTAPEFQTKLLQATGSGAANVVLDFSAVGYIASGGLRAITIAMKQKSSDQRIGVVGLQGGVEEIFTIAGFQQVLPIFATIAEAAQAWGEPLPPIVGHHGSARE